MPAGQPIRELFRVSLHLSPKLFKSQPLDLLVPSQSLQQDLGAGDRVVAEEFDDFRHVTQRDRGPVIFPVPDCGGGDADLKGDIFLVQSKRKTATTQVIAEGNGFFDEFFRWLYFKGNFYFMRSFL